MLSLRQRLSIVLVVLALMLPAPALEWKTQTLSALTTPFQSTQEAVFEFTNTSTKPVVILELKTNCDCLDAAADQKVYAPGASGVIKTRFTVGDRTGLYERTITILTDEAVNPVRLLLRIEVPEVAILTPRNVAWKINEPATEKSIEIQTVSNLEITFSEAESTNPAITARLETIEAGQHYRLHLRPQSTARPASAAIRVSGHEKSGHLIVLSAYGNVQ